MRSFWLFGPPVVLLASAIAFACSGSSTSSFGSNPGKDGASDDGSGGATGDDAGDDGCGILGCSGDTAPPCQNLQCKWQPCAPQGKPETELTGTIWDPAARLPLYNVYVYVPNATPDPIKPGNPTCTQCEAPASGSPLIGALTDEKGHFSIKHGPTDQWGVPGGDDIPLVIQVGKWRRQVKIPHVDNCATSNLDQTLGKDKLRLPKKSSEGDMPLIAFTSGACDPAECFLRHIGIDDSEFVPPQSASGHVHFYTGNGGSTISGGNTQPDTYQWWTSSANLLKYDIVFNACECSPYDRGAGAYQAMHDYLDKGGRTFATHYYYNWFAPPTGPSDFQSVAQWTPEGFGGDQGVESVDMSFPKGKAFGNWLKDNGISSALGQIPLVTERDDVTALQPSGCDESKGTCLSTRWIYHPQDNHPRYLSFNAPTTVPTNKQCGRAVFSDVHLSADSNPGGSYPAQCSGLPDGAHDINEKALEFLFFDLSSCVQNDSQPPPPPTPQ